MEVSGRVRVRPAPSCGAIAACPFTNPSSWERSQNMLGALPSNIPRSPPIRQPKAEKAMHTGTIQTLDGAGGDPVL